MNWLFDMLFSSVDINWSSRFVIALVVLRLAWLVDRHYLRRSSTQHQSKSSSFVLKETKSDTPESPWLAVVEYLYLCVRLQFERQPEAERKQEAGDATNTTSGEASSSTEQQEALQLFDSLDVIDDLDFLTGLWKGEEYPTGHRLDGLLEAYHWYGKRFENADQVHPLLFVRQQKCESVADASSAKNNDLQKQQQQDLIQIDAGSRWFGYFVIKYLLPVAKIPRSSRAVQLAHQFLPLLQTHKSSATLCTTQHRGKVTTCMKYNRIPVQDFFRKMDKYTVLGMMEIQGMEQPFFFRLHRETKNSE